MKINKEPEKKVKKVPAKKTAEKKKTESSKKASPKRSVSLKTLESTQMWSPIKDILDGIVITKDGKFVQIMEFAPINYALLPKGEQIAIADTFGAIVRMFPKEFHIKVLSRKASVEMHIRNLRNCIAHESNPQCRRLQEQSIEQIQADAFSGVSRRFFISFPYESPGGLRRPTWDDIRNDLHLKAQQIASYLGAEPCNNELLSPIGSTEHTMNILYDCMCRTESEFKPFDEKLADIICQHIVEHGFKDDGEKQIPPNDFLCPKRIDRHGFSYIVVDGKYYCFGYIHRNSYEMHQSAGWLARLVNLGEGIDLDIWVQQKNPKEEKTKLVYAMQISQSEAANKSTTSGDFDTLSSKIDSEQYLRMGLSKNHKLFYFSIMVTVVADSLNELKAKYKLVSENLYTNSFSLNPLHFNQDLAFKSSLPLCQPEHQVTRFAKRNILSCDFGAAYPFTSYEINDPNGVMIGRNASNNSPLFLDFFNRFLYTNGNGVILGSAGAGKTYLLLCLASRLRQYQTQTIIITPYKGHEYGPLCEAIGGTFISLAPGSEQNINVMEIRRYDTSNNAALDGAAASNSSILIAKTAQLHTLFSLLMPDMSHEEKQILDDAFIQTYKRFGITRANKSLEDPKRPGYYKPMPTLGDLDTTLAGNKAAAKLRTVIARFVSGTCKNFNGPTNVNLANPFVVIDVSSMPTELMPVAIFIATDFVYDTIRADRLRQKAIIMDELSRMIGIAGSSAAAEFVLTLYKTVRAYNTIVLSATQDINDFFSLHEGWYGKGILANSQIKVVLKQEPTEADKLADELHLSDYEKQKLPYYSRGQGLLIAKRNHAEIRVVASPYEHMLFNTDPEQQKRFLEHRKNT